MDALDLPLLYNIGASYVVEGSSQAVSKGVGHGLAQFRQAGVIPYRSLDARREPYPMLRFPWAEVRDALRALASVTAADEPVHVAYVNPETGRECLPTLGFSALMLRAGETARLERRSASAVLHAVEGSGTAHVAGNSHEFMESDTMAVPNHADVAIQNGSSAKPCFLFIVDDAPLHRKLGIYETFGRSRGA
jgi:gentisate 1,2-dioxygenase